jgi:MEKHLA domain-containing protein
MKLKTITRAYEPSDLRTDPTFFNLLTGSYARIVGERLVPDRQGPVWLYNNAPFVVVAHNTEPDPRFIYANKSAQVCFEYSWDEFTRLPSRLSAEAPDRAERQQLLDAVTRNGFMAGYRGLRIAKSGRRFWIEDGLVWQLIDEDGISHGQAAVFSSWRSAREHEFRAATER